MSDLISSSAEKLLGAISSVETLASKYQVHPPSDGVFAPKDWADDVQWFVDRIKDTERRWGCPEPKTNAALWLFSASHTLLGSAIIPYLIARQAFRVDLDTVWLASNGYLGGVQVVGTCSLEEALSDLAQRCEALVESLSRASGYSRHQLRMLVADGISMACNTALRHGLSTSSEVMDVATRASKMFTDLGFGRTARFVSVREGAMTALAEDDEPCSDANVFVLRSSCCQIYRLSGRKCVLCNRQPEAVLAERLVAHVAELTKRQSADG